jgi:hypothetical protein
MLGFCVITIIVIYHLLLIYLSHSRALSRHEQSIREFSPLSLLCPSPDSPYQSMEVHDS